MNATRLEAMRRLLGEKTEEEWKTTIIAALKKGYEQDGLDGLKMAAYHLEGGGASKQMLSSLLKQVVRDQELDGLKMKSKSKHGFVLLGMYADDLRRGH